MAHYQVGQNQACEVYAQSAERISTIGCPKTDSSAVVLPFERPKCQAAVSLPEQVPLSVDLQSCLEEADSDQSHLCQSCHSFVGPASHNYPKEQSEGSQPTRPTSMAATTDNVDHEGSCVTMTSKHVATPTAQDSSSRIASARAGADPGPKPRCCESFPDSLAPAIPVLPISPVSVIFSSTLCSPGEAGSGHSERMDSQQSPSWLQAAPHAQQDGCFPFAGCSSVSNSLNDAQSAASAAAAHIPNPVRHSQATPWRLGGGAGDDDDDQDMATPTRLSPRDSHPVITTTPVLEPTITKGVMLVVPRDVRDEVDDKTMMMMMMLDDPVQVDDDDGVNVASNVVSYSSSFAKLSSSSASSKHVPLLAMHDEKAKDAADGDGDDDDARGAGPVSQRPVPPEVKSPSRFPSAMTATNARIPTVSSFKNVKYQSIMMNYSGVKNPPSATYHTDVEKAKTCYPVGPASNRRWGVPVGWGLRGGGETSLTTPSGAGGWGNSTGTGGGGNASWGAPGAGSGPAGGAIGGTGANSVAAPPNQWGAVASNARANTGAPSQGPNGNPNNNPSMNPAAGGNGSNGGGSKVITPNPSTSPGQNKNCAGGGAANANNGPGNAANGNGGGPGNGTGGGVSAASKQLEQLSSIREAIYSPDGWGGNNVNQDTVWETPPSPEPGSKENLPLWKQTSANDGSSLAGTEIWEASLRNGGQPPAAPAQPKAPWGHTPTSHIGGTWGEDDDAGDSSNMWTGIPANNAPPQWGAPPVPGAGPGPVPAPGPTGMGPGVGNAAQGNPMWGPTAHKKEEWGAPPGAMGPNTAGWGTGGRMMGNMGHGPEGMGGDMGISGPTGPSHWGGPPNKGPGSQWGAPVPPVKEIKTSGWDEPSPPTQKRPAPSVDDGTALWGNPTQQQNKVSHWKEMPMPNIAGRGGMPGPGGPPPGRFPPGGPAMKPEMPMWPHQSRNGSWGDGSEGMWMEDKSNAGWGEPPQTPSWSAGPKPKTPTTPSNWGESEMDPSSWGQPPKPVHPKPQPKEMIWGSKQFRILTELGYKKEDVETCLRASNMVMEDALEMLNAGRGGLGMEPWRRAQEDHSGGYDMGGHPGGMPYPPHGRGGYNPQQAMPYHGAGTHLLNNAPAGLGGLGGINPGPGYKLLQSQQPPPLPPQSQPPMGFPGGRTNRGDMNVGGGGGQPTQTQLRVLVQQIQMAVQAGHLNPQILNQPLAPQTLLLLNQLLQNIKLLQTLSQQQAVAQAAFGGKAPQGPMANQLMSLMQQANKTKQQITSLQNQINTQQALFVKQSAYVGGQPPGGSPGQTTSDLFKAGGGIEPVNNLKDSFNQLTIDPHAGQSQSRLTQWTMPSMDKKDMDLGVGGLNDFSRAPGTSSAITPGGKPPLNSSLSSPNLNPLLSQGESTWSSLSRSQSESGWPDSTGNDTNDGKEWSSGMSNYSSISDLVPEFEPGKPWKGPQLKTVDDDPTLTPGQFAMSALKDPDLFSAGGSSNATGSGNGSAVSGAKTSPPPGGNSSSSDSAFTPMSLSSSTWSFNPSATSSNANVGGTSTSGSSGFSSAFNKYGPPKGSWGTDAPPPSGNNAGELWGMGPKRGPPPGLASTAPGANNSNVGSQGGKGPSWGSSGAGGVSGGSNGGQRSGSTSSWGASTGGGPGSGGSSAWGQPTTAWLMLRNLTPQIDGSTLKTLCVQHGPLHTFHLYLNQGIALVRYSTNEEAAKAQAALNNCVLSNTTILADLASESDVQQWLQQLGHSSQQQQQQQQQSNQTGGSSWSVRGSTPGASSSSGGPAQNKPNTDSWGGSSVGVGGATSPLWPSNSGSVWSTPALDRDSLRATPSSLNATLNSFLPGDLLGGESM